jgi:5-methylcytosine-specific restriction endonuclease McrA
MGLIGRSCTVCGARTKGASRCAKHVEQAGRHKRKCLQDGCTERVWGKWCDEHKPLPPGSTRTEAERLAAQPWREGYRDPAYHRERQAARRRAGGRCERCRRSKGDVCVIHDAPIKLECDHVIPLSKGGTNSRGNFEVLCACCCHRAKTHGRT